MNYTSKQVLITMYVIKCLQSTFKFQNKTKYFILFSTLHQFPEVLLYVCEYT